MSGWSIIHNLNTNKIFGKIGVLTKNHTSTLNLLTIGSLVLVGILFLTGFYSKDHIIETANIFHTQTLDAWILIATSDSMVHENVHSLRDRDETSR